MESELNREIVKYYEKKKNITIPITNLLFRESIERDI